MATDLVADATEQLYSIDPAGFVDLRTRLATDARRAGDPRSARQIAALRRPTQAAWLLNRLARSDPDLAGRLAELGGRLAQAQRRLDGPALRQLSNQRRRLVEDLARRALTGHRTASTALADDVRSTLEAALADPEVAQRLGAGVLVRVERWSGFGPTATALSLVPDEEPEHSAPGPDAESPEDDRTVAGAGRTDEAARQRAEADDAVLAAEAELEEARQAEQRARDDVGVLSEQLADARRRHDDAGLELRRVEQVLARARARLAGLPETQR